MSDHIDRQADLSGYSDQLWKNTYQRCKRDATAEIVHCKDCAYFSEHKDYYMCGVNVFAYARVDDYYNRAERRTDDVSL